MIIKKLNGKSYMASMSMKEIKKDLETFDIAIEVSEDTKEITVPDENYNVFLRCYGNKSYGVAIKRPTEQEFKAVAENCQCPFHQSWIKLPFITAPCPCCVGCLQETDRYNFSPYVYKQTKEYMEQNSVKPCYYLF